MSLKIAIIGTHCVGKTTLCKKLKSYLESQEKKVELITEVVRECPFPVNETATLQTQNWILNEQKKKEMELQNSCDFMITDRGLIDNYAYWKRVAEKTLLPKEIESTEREVLKHSKSYDIIFFLQPFEDIPENDGFRSVDPVWRNEMHSRIKEILKKLEKPVIILKGSENKVFKKASSDIDMLMHFAG